MSALRVGSVAACDCGQQLSRIKLLKILNNSKQLLGLRYATNSASVNAESQRSSVLSSSSPNSSQPPIRDRLDLTFSNTKEAYKSKTTYELLRAYFVLKLCSYDFIVYNHSKAFAKYRSDTLPNKYSNSSTIAEKLIKTGRTILGQRLFNYLMQKSFYGQFVAGENEVEIRPILDHLRSFGVKSILDYSAEEDISEEQAINREMVSCTREENQKVKLANPSNPQSFQQVPDKSCEPIKQYKPHQEFADRRKYGPVARTYFYLNEANCEKNMDTFLKCIDAVAGVTDSTGFAAIKITALGRPALLLQLSEVIARTRKYFTEITGEQTMALGHVSREEFQKTLDTRFHIKTDNEDVKQWFKGMDYDKRGLMNIFSWNGLIDMQYLISDLFKIPNLTSGKLEPIITALTREEEEMFRNMMRRIHHIAQNARERDVRVLIDAEQTYFQPAINRITMELMRKYNKEKAVIFNTYQCYLKSAYDSATIDLELARRQNFFFAAKLVRGAYMEQERERARHIGYEDPINPSYEATSEMYHKTLNYFMQKIIETGVENKKIAIMVATHNEDTIRHTVNKMKEFGISPQHKVLCFGQLYGMCDQISFLLGQSGYSVYKYVPYGPIEEVLPYISRRALENHGLLKKAKKERSLLLKEVMRRIKCRELFHKPIGNYTPV